MEGVWFSGTRDPSLGTIGSDFSAAIVWINPSTLIVFCCMFLAQETLFDWTDEGL